MLEGQVAQAYVQLRGAQALTASQQENVRTSQAALDLTSKRARQGLATDLDVEQARTQLDDTEYQLPGYEKQAEQAMNRLSVLTGQPPGTLDAMLGPSAPLPVPPATIGIGVPSDTGATTAGYSPGGGAVACGDGECRGRSCQLLSGCVADRQLRPAGAGCQLPDQLGEQLLLIRTQRFAADFPGRPANRRICVWPGRSRPRQRWPIAAPC